MTIGYYGGKAGSTGKWIVSMLPDIEPGQIYIETHAGMMGVLLQRGKADIEIANDLNGRIVNWWLVVRDRIDDLMDLLDGTPMSERLYHEYCGSLDEGDEVMRALKMTIVLQQGFSHGDGQPGGWLRIWRKSNLENRRSRIARIRDLRERVRDVQFFEEPAIDLLDRVKSRSNAVIYIDPPYRNAATTSPYAVDRQDYHETLDAVLAQSGRVAVSGYDDDWDALLEHGWRRYERETIANVAHATGTRPKRVEVLWTNYDAGIKTADRVAPSSHSAPPLF